MGVTLNIRLIDHDTVVVRGLAAVNEAIAERSPTILLAYIGNIPFEPDSAIIKWREARCEQLRKIKSPQVIIDNEQRLLRLVTGEAYTQKSLEKLNFDDLRELLGTWGRAQSFYNLDKAWYALEWFLQPIDDPKEMRPEVGNSAQTLADKALHGSEASLLDVDGLPVIRACGSNEEGCFGYNPPDVVASVQQWLEDVDSSSWKKLLSRRARFNRLISPALDELMDEVVADELELARSALLTLKLAYRVAAERRRGVACEFSM